MAGTLLGFFFLSIHPYSRDISVHPSYPFHLLTSPARPASKEGYCHFSCNGGRASLRHSSPYVWSPPAVPTADAVSGYGRIAGARPRSAPATRPRPFPEALGRGKSRRIREPAPDSETDCAVPNDAGSATISSRAHQEETVQCAPRRVGSQEKRTHVLF